MKARKQSVINVELVRNYFTWMALLLRTESNEGELLIYHGDHHEDKQRDGPSSHLTGLVINAEQKNGTKNLHLILSSFSKIDFSMIVITRL